MTPLGHAEVVAPGRDLVPVDFEHTRRPDVDLASVVKEVVHAQHVGRARRARVSTGVDGCDRPEAQASLINP